LPGNEERNSELQLLKEQLSAIQGKLIDANLKVKNLTEAISVTDSAAVRDTLTEKLAQVLEDQADHESVVNRLNKEITINTLALTDTTAKIESLKGLLTFLRERDGQELIDTRRRLREELRNLIERIDIFPVGQVQNTDESMSSQTENKELREYTILFKGKSYRTISPNHPLKMVVDADYKTRLVRNWTLKENGEIDYWEYEG
jgi:hypothetical protein